MQIHTDSSLANIYIEINRELDRAIKKHPIWPNDEFRALAILGEEFGELTRELNHKIDSPESYNKNNVRKEAIQTAAMAVRFLINLKD